MRRQSLVNDRIPIKDDVSKEIDSLQMAFGKVRIVYACVMRTRIRTRTKAELKINLNPNLGDGRPRERAHEASQ